MQKTGKIEKLSIGDIRNTTKDNCTKLIDAIGAVVDRNLGMSCSVVSVNHSYEYKILITNKTSSVQLETKEKPGNTLRKTNEPTELHFFTYEKLKESAKLNHGKYRGKLYGTIELCKCDKTISCPDCDGTGICSSCDGEKQIVCTVCNGDKECISCNGTGTYTCTNCDGDGDCPECNDGWYTCDECNGDGTMDCPDCNGSGNYVDSTCNKCGGSGYYDYYNNKVCRACGGSGRFVITCKRCDGDGTVDCDNCDGDGGWDCKECHGSGKCSHCHGEGGFTCKACSGSGSCGKCKGRGKIWCPDCHGKGKCFDCKGEKIVTCPRCDGLGKYQSYTQYSLSDNETKRELCSIPINASDIEAADGDCIYNNVIYDFFAGRANTYDDKNILQQVSADKIEIVKDWISLEKNSTFTKDHIGKDYLNTKAELTKLPVSKIVIRCNSTNYSIWIVGKNKVIFYDDLPSFAARLFGGLSKLFGGK